MRLRSRVVLAALAAGSATLGFVPVAHADSTTTLAASASAWYQPNPSCAAPSGCVTTSTLPVAPPVDVPLSPYQAGTFHVAYGGGQETARSYLAFPYEGIDGTVTGGTLDVPLDVATADGSAQPETSHVQACLVSATITPTEGSISPPPLASCEQHALLTYVAKPAPHLHADLAPLLGGLVTTSGIALLPDATAPQTDAWHVVFSSASRTDTGKTDPPVMKLAVTPSSSSDVVDTPVDLPSSAPVAVLPNTPSMSVGTPSLPQTDLSAVTAPEVQAPAAAAPQAAPRTITVGYAYPAVWLLPLVFLVLVPLGARALTTDLTPTT